jgi:ribosome-binding factor A
MFQVNELLRQEISTIILTEMNDPRFQMVTVTGVKTSSDLHHARVFVNVHQSDARQREETIESLQRGAGRIQHLVGKRVRIKYIPQLDFVYDDRLDYAENIYKTLENLKKEHPEQPDGGGMEPEDESQKD